MRWTRVRASRPRGRGPERERERESKIKTKGERSERKSGDDEVGIFEGSAA